MSRRVPSREMVPKRPSSTRSQTSKPSVASARSSTSARPSRTSAKPSTTSAKESTEVKPKKEFELPALSLSYKPKITESELEKLKKKTIRRHAPPGEDLKEIKNILKSIKGQNISVQEFIALIAPSTGDNGEVLRSVMIDDLNAFRKLARKVYDTITKDNSDVLLNQQMQLAEYYREKKNLLHDKMMRQIEEIYMMAANFDFDRYAAEGKKYLEEILPLPEELKVEPEEIEMMKRQAAYHRLQWLRSEGERLNEENNSLKRRLNQLKIMHKEEQMRMMDMERDAEAKKEELEAEQADKVETLEILNESLEKTIIDKEKDIRLNTDKVLLEKTGAIKKQITKKKSKGAIKKQRRPPWNQEAAKEIEAQVLEKSQAAETSKIMSSSYYSPSRVAEAPRPTSPFHFSPPKAPSPEGAYYVPPPPTRIAPSTTPSEQRYGRRAPAPRDTWSGFY